jgi:hypothetical protein
MSCGTRALKSRPGDPDGALLLRSSLFNRSLPNFPVRAPAAGTFTEMLLTNVAAARSSSLAGPVVSLGYARNHTHETSECLLRSR